ncbi:MAG: hypothetical protein M3Q26_01850 [Acidobacteriota bacterium]|nr:hypothetical protein [Acidobacteriota bacterium]
MSNFSCHFLIAMLLLLGPLPAAPQAPAVGSLEVSGRVKIDGKQEKLSRKRFYLLRGGLNENKELVARLKAVEITSRDCFYSQMNASSEFICWLKAENCDSPYCRDATAEEVELVPEFLTAYKKGLKQFRGRTAVAQDWLTTNLPPNLVSGYYRQRRALTDNLLSDIRPLQSSMTDSVTVKAIFIDIPVSADGTNPKTSGTFLVSNILPIEFGNKSYVWACEVEVGPSKPAILRLQVPENNKPVKNCEVAVRDLPVCKTGSCPPK